MAEPQQTQQPQQEPTEPQPHQPRAQKRSPQGWKERFLNALRNSGNVRAAAQAAGITRENAYQYRNRSKEFRAEWESAMEDAIDVLEAVAFRRAQETSDTLLIFLLKSHRPERYADRVRLDIIKQEAERLAEGTEFTADELIAQAEEILKRNGVR